MLDLFEFFAIFIIAFFIIIVSYGIYMLSIALMGITKLNKEGALDFFKRVYAGLFTALFIFFILQLRDIISSLDTTNLNTWNYIVLLVGNSGLYILLFLFLICLGLIIYLLLFER